MQFGFILNYLYRMKFRKHKLLSFLFLSIFLSSLAFGISNSLINSIPNIAHFSKNKEIKCNCHDEFSNENFVFEENENENESETNLNALALLLPFFASDFISQYTSFTFNFSDPVKEKTTTSIFIAIRNFRI